MFASLVEYACVSFEVNRKVKRGLEIPVMQTESDDGKVLLFALFPCLSVVLGVYLYHVIEITANQNKSVIFVYSTVLLLLHLHFPSCTRICHIGCVGHCIFYGML